MQFYYDATIGAKILPIAAQKNQPTVNLHGLAIGFQFNYLIG
jgi:hypothetical protein